MRDVHLDENAPIDHPEGPALVSRFGPDRIRVYRKFSAPRDALFEAHFNADQIRTWRNSAEKPIRDCDIALHPGGSARMTWGDARGSTLCMRFQEVAVPARVVYQEEYDTEGAGTPVLSTILMIPLPGGTLMTQEFWYASPEARDAALTPTLEAELEEDYARLEAMLLG